MKALSWFSPSVGDGMGYGYAAIKTIEALNSRGVRVDYLSDKWKSRINFIQPEWYEFLPNGYNIGYTPWESTEIDPSWLENMNRCDQIWTPSTFCKEVFEKSGVEVPVKVVPHGIDPSDYPITDREVDDLFVFLHIGGGAARKNAEMVGDAFLEVFDGQHNVHLLMKSNGPSEARWRDSPAGQVNISRHPQVTVLEHYLPIEDMQKLYAGCHAMVYPSNGEGFGLIPFQAIATGMPTICTNGTSMTDFANLSIPLSCTWTKGEGIHLGDWCVPDYEELKRLMRDAYYNWDSHRNKAMESAHWILENQTWGHVADQIIELLGDNLYNEAAS